MGSEYVESISIDQSNQLKCAVFKFTPIAMIQSRISDFPYISWKLRSIADDVAFLTLITKWLALNFEIGADYVKLIEFE